MNIETLRFYRNLLFRTLVVIFFLNVLMYSATMALWDTWTGLVSAWFHVPAEGLGATMLDFFTAVKFFAIYILLAPALALHWSIKAQQKHTSA